MLVTDIPSLAFGYLSGADLVLFASPQLLLTQENIVPRIMQRSCSIAYAEMISKLSARCQITTELSKAAPTTDPDTRSQIIVKYTSLYALRNILAKVPGLSEQLKAEFADAIKCVDDIRMGQAAIPDLQVEATADQTNISRTELIKSSFGTIG